MNYLLFVYFFLHLVFTWSLCSVSWFVDVIFFPSYKLVAKKRFQEFEVGYLKKTLYTIVPIMIAEGITAILLWYKSYSSYLYYPAFINFILLVIIWIMHFRQGMKYHRKLAEEGFHTKTFQRLSKMHRWRTLIWSVRALGLLFFGFYFF